MLKLLSQFERKVLDLFKVSPTKIVVSLFLAFCLVTSARILTNRPWVDEALFASSAVNLVRQGFLGNTILVPRPALTSLREYMFWQPPVYFILQAGLYFLFGVGVVQARLLSLLAGAVALWAIYSVSKKLLQSFNWAVLVTLLVAVDYRFVSSASTGRMDMLAVMFFWLSIYAYLYWRDKNFPAALVISNSLVVLSGLTHPNGVIALLVISFMIFYLDRARWRWKYLALVVLPYLVGGLTWAAYIWQSPESFITQFSANLFRLESATYVTGLRLKTVEAELSYRYLDAYGHLFKAGVDLIVIAAAVPVFLFYLLSLILGFKRLRERNSLLQWQVLLIVVLLMVFVIANKTTIYLVWLSPLYIFNAVFVARNLVESKSQLRYLYYLGFVFLLSVSLAANVNHILQNKYENQYRQDLARFTEDYYQGGLIYGSSELAFFYDFDQEVIQDDIDLGYFSGIKAEYIVISKRYRDYFEQTKKQDTKLSSYISRLINEDYELLFTGNYSSFYRRAPSA